MVYLWRSLQKPHGQLVKYGKLSRKRSADAATSLDRRIEQFMLQLQWIIKALIAPELQPETMQSRLKFVIFGIIWDSDVNWFSFEFWETSDRFHERQFLSPTLGSSPDLRKSLNQLRFPWNLCLWLEKFYYFWKKRNIRSDINVPCYAKWAM